jgi:hypothetical protein
MAPTLAVVIFQRLSNGQRHNTQETPEYGAFVVASQVPSGQKWAETPWENGSYVQSEDTFAGSMCLTVNLIHYVSDPNNLDTLIYTEFPLVFDALSISGVPVP